MDLARGGKHELDPGPLIDRGQGKVTCAGFINPTPTQMFEGTQL